MEKRPSKGLTLFLSFISGAGHLYLGAMSRGLQFMILFFGSIALADFLSFNFFPFWIPVIWFYALFDAMQLASQQTIEDKPLLPWSCLKGPGMGWALIILGVLGIAGELLPPFGNTFLTDYLRGWYSLNTLVIAAILLIFGVVMLKGKKVKTDD